jgi:hypothetical protein
MHKKTQQFTIPRPTGRGKAEGNHPFTTPPGYFENLASRVMDALPEDNTAKKTKQRRITWFLTMAAAACMAGAFFFINFSKGTSMEEQMKQSDFGAAMAQMTSTEDDSEEKYNQDMLNYALVDNSDVYCYLSGTGM